MKTFKYLGIAFLALQLTACFDNELALPNGDNNNTQPPVAEAKREYSAAIITVDSSFMGGAVQIADMNKQGVSTLSPEVISQSASDYTVSAFGEHFYHIGRYQIDTLQKYAFSNPTQDLLNGGWDLLGSDSDSNTYDIVFVNEEKAYMIRYGSNSVWIINPSATDQANFKLGELDLSAYDDGDGVVEMAAAKIVGDKLFIAMQRLNNWCPTDDAYVAVFDIKTDTEVNVDSANDPLGLKGIRLAVKNVSNIDYQEDIGLIVSGVGAGTIFACTPPNRYSGGIEVIHPGSYQTTLLIDDGDETNHPYDFISNVIALDKNNGYFVSYAGWGDTKLYHFNPSTAEVTGMVPGFDDAGQIDIRILEKSPENTAWVGLAGVYGVSEFAELYVLDKQQNVEEHFGLERDPEAVAFAAEPLPKNNSIQPPFAPAHDKEGTTALSHNDPTFVAWATGYENYKVGTHVDATWKTPERALGYPGNSDGTNRGFTGDIVVLGRGGEITLTFDQPIMNGEGYDFAVFENSFSSTFLELAWVEVSSDGVNFYRFPNYSFTANPVGGFGNVDPTNIHGLAGKYRGGYGTPFDLDELKDQVGLDVDNITHVKIIDIVGNGTALDSLGNIIYEPYPTTGSAGFDLDAIGVIHQKQ